jgi:hypothetical protein
MKVKRRRFIQTLAAAPAVSAAAPQRGPAPTGTAAPKLTNATADSDAETTPRFFTPVQFAALRRLGALFMPPRKGLPGALDAGAPEFVDFLISDSPAERQQLYRNGLDTFNARAKKRYGKSFAELDDNRPTPSFVPSSSPLHGCSTAPPIRWNTSSRRYTMTCGPLP